MLAERKHLLGLHLTPCRYADRDHRQRRHPLWRASILAVVVLAFLAREPTDLFAAVTLQMAQAVPVSPPTGSNLSDSSFRELLNAVEQYQNQESFADARELLEKSLKDTPPVDSERVGQRVELRKKLAEVNRAIAASAEKRIRGLITELQKATDDVKRTVVRKELQAALGDAAVIRNTNLAAEIARVLKKSDAGVLAPLPGFLQTALNTSQTAAETAGRVFVEVLIYFVFLVLAALLFRLFRNRVLPRRGVGLALEDETADEGARENANRKLNMLMAHEIRTIERADTLGIEAAGLSDQAGTEFALGKAAELKTLIDDSPIKVGVISFNPQQVFALLTRLFSRQHEYLLVGSLTQAHDMTLLAVTKREPTGVPVEGESYHASRHDNDGEARAHVVRDVAIQFACRNASSVVTQDWRSLRAFLESEDILEEKNSDERRDAVLQQAVAKLRQSLRYDPSNWMARHNLGIVLRRLGCYKYSGDQFDYLRRMLESKGISGSEHYESFVKRQPDFEWMVSYNLALSQAESGDGNDVDKAITTIGHLLQQVGGGEGPGVLRRVGTTLRITKSYEALDPKSYTADQLRHIALARSARAVANATKLDLLSQKMAGGIMNGKEVQNEMDAALKQVDEDEEWIWRVIGEGNVSEVNDWQAFTRAHSAAQNARGRAHYIVGDDLPALKYLTWAVSIHAPEAFADPFVNLAAVILSLKNKHAVDWAKQAEKHLETALEINRHHSRAQLLLGTVYADSSPPRYDEAEEMFEAAGDNWESLEAHARVLVKQDKERDKAIRLLRKSLKFKPRADDRARLLAELISKAATDEIADKGLIEEGIELAEDLVQHGVEENLKQEGERLGDILKGRLAEIGHRRGEPPRPAPPSE